MREIEGNRVYLNLNVKLYTWNRLVVAGKMAGNRPRRWLPELRSQIGKGRWENEVWRKLSLKNNTNGELTFFHRRPPLKSPENERKRNREVDSRGRREQEKVQQFGRGGMYGGKLAAVAAASPVGNEWRWEEQGGFGERGGGGGARAREREREREMKRKEGDCIFIYNLGENYN